MDFSFRFNLWIREFLFRIKLLQIENALVLIHNPFFS